MEREGFLMAAQDEALRTNSVKKLFDNQIGFPDMQNVWRKSRNSEPSSSRMHCTCTETVQVMETR